MEILEEIFEKGADVFSLFINMKAGLTSGTVGCYLLLCVLDIAVLVSGYGCVKCIISINIHKLLRNVHNAE